VTKNRNEGEGGSAGWDASWNRARQTQRSGGSGTTYNRQLVPIMKWRPVLKFIEHLSLDDQKILTASEIASFGVGELFLYISGLRPCKLSVPLLGNYLRECPTLLDRRIREFLQATFENPLYAEGQVLLDQRNELLQLTVTELRRLQRQQTQETTQQMIASPNNRLPQSDI